MAGEGATIIEALYGKELNYTSGTVSTLTSDTLLTVSGSYNRSSQKFQYPAMTGRAGATATVGYVNTGVNTNLVTLAQNATADTWVIPITGLHEGDVITAIGISGQIESGGNAVTVDYALRATTAATADCTDAVIQAGTQIAKSADYEIADSTAVATPHTVIDGESCYMLITITTAAATDVQLQYVSLTVSQR